MTNLIHFARVVEEIATHAGHTLAWTQLPDGSFKGKCTKFNCNIAINVTEDNNDTLTIEKEIPQCKR